MSDFCPRLQDFEAKSVKISFDKSGPASTFNAPWLWQNDFRNIMKISGQRKESPGAWDRRIVIVDAAIHHHASKECQSMLQECGAGADFVTKTGAIHPINTNPTQKKENGNGRNQHFNPAVDNDVSGLLLVVTWKKQTIGEVLKSFYNLLWLKEWTYDAHRASELRMAREVSEHHTFLYKYKKMKDEEGSSPSRDSHLGLLSADYSNATSDKFSDDSLRLFDVSVRN